MEAVIIILVVVVGLIAGYFEHKRRQARIAELTQWARAGGWMWRPAKVRSPQHCGSSLFNQGRSRYSYHHLARTMDPCTPGLGAVGVEMFAYHYAITRHTGKHSHTQHYRFQCAVINQDADLGSVDIRDEGWGDKLIQGIGFDDIDLEDPEFSKRFVVKARDRKDAYALIGPGLMQFLLTRPGWRIETAGTQLLMYRSGRLDAGACAEIVSFISGFLAQLPRTLVNSTRARQGLAPVIEGGAASTSSRSSRTGALESQDEPQESH